MPDLDSLGRIYLENTLFSIKKIFEESAYIAGGVLRSTKISAGITKNSTKTFITDSVYDSIKHLCHKNVTYNFGCTKIQRVAVNCPPSFFPSWPVFIMVG